MANSLTKGAVTPYSLRYLFVFDSAASQIKSITTLLADCAVGPLKTLLNAVGVNGLNAGISGLTWLTLAASRLVTINIVPQGTSGTASGDFTATFEGNAPPSLNVTGDPGAATISGYVEIRYNHSLAR